MPIHEDLPKHELCFPEGRKNFLSAVVAARLLSDEKGKIESKFFEKHQRDAAYRHRDKILVTLHLSIETVSIRTNKNKNKTEKCADCAVCKDNNLAQTFGTSRKRP